MAIFAFKKKSVFIESEQFNQMMAYNPYVETRADRTKVKYMLLDRIEAVLGDKWYRLKDGTRQSFDMICFLGAELGFVYAGAEYLAKRHNVSDRTIRNRFKELEQLGQVVKLYRRTSKCNGRGKPVYLFVNHPYFQYWIELLNLSKFLTDFQTENAQTSSESKDTEQKRVPTYSLTNSFNSIYRYIDDKRTIGSTVHNESNINLLIENFRLATKGELTDRSFRSVVRKVIDKYNQGLVKNFRDYLATSLSNKINGLELRRLQDKAKRDYKQSKGQQSYEQPYQRIVPFYNWLVE